MLDERRLGWHPELVRRRAGAMHVDSICSHQKAADGTVREYRSHLLRHSFRDEQGRRRKETLANLTALPAAAHVMASRLGLRTLLGPACRERDIAYALILSRAVRPRPKLSTVRWWEDD